ncbi:hypothetical protein LTR62_004327 [Meristemomyces frigidus]|uniref:Enoyl reductase (ER) domain-containing protein n=1 Tax=Meristemomyces frigidus TaxID=1508187 RepID=A0AAN7TMK3_9PEZI|nr:hypothetical protein LTR62_004327 [Meristemomyces frigidus]
MQAITIHSTKAKISTVPLPKLEPTLILAKVEAIALNPTDWKHIAFDIAPPNAICGCDFAGTVIEVGSAVTKSLKPGDRIAGVVHGAKDAENGAFAEYCVAQGDLAIRIPDELSFEKAATLPLGIATVGQGLYQQGLKLPLPIPAPVSKTSGEQVLIYGGSTATGSLAIQFARLSGHEVLTTCSARNNELVRSLGAKQVYDYRSASIGAKINSDTNNGLRLIYDTIGSPDSAKICQEAMSSDTKGTRYATIIGPPAEFKKEGVEPVVTMMYTIFNSPMMYFGQHVPAIADDYEFGKVFFGITEQLLAEGRLKTHPEVVGGKGLEGALEGMREMSEEKVSGVKLVYRVADTPVGSEAEADFGEAEEDGAA